MKNFQFLQTDRCCCLRFEYLIRTESRESKIADSRGGSSWPA